MIHNSTNLLILPPNESMGCYKKRSRMQVFGTWATEMGIIGTASLLQTFLYLYGPSGKINKWKNHSPDQVNDDPHIDQSIYITNCDFETLKSIFF